MHLSIEHAKIYIKTLSLYFLQNKKLYYVTGMRRSGNHAFIRWLANALEENFTKLNRSNDFGHLNYSESRKTVFLNEVNKIGVKGYFKMLWKYRNLLKNCDHVIISTEDYSSYTNNWRSPIYDFNIYVCRSVLNVVASRIQHLQNKAAEGVGQPRQYVDACFFKKLNSWREPPREFHVWNYDQWLISEQYRKDFLQSLRLNADIHPSVSSEGGGSSFTGEKKIPLPRESLNRYKQKEFSKVILEHLAENRELLTPAELKYLDEEYSFPQNYLNKP